MDIISKILFGIANSLLIPDIILLIFFFIKAVIMAGMFYSQYIILKNNNKKFLACIDNFKKEDKELLLSLLPEKDNYPVIPFLRMILEKGNDEKHAEYIISNFENTAARDLAKSRILTKIGPILGLMGTLIAMSPALVGLSTGDIAGMAYNMQVVFATTVVGLVISAVGLVTQLYKQRWYEKDVNNLLFISRVLQEEQ